MGIVVTVFMLLALIVLTPAANRRVHSTIQLGIAILVLMAGLWNVFYGVQNWQAFWGIAAVVSGSFMLLAAILIMGRSCLVGRTCKGPVIAGLYHRLLPLSTVVVVGLIICFLLYAVTLVQLNLGYPIIR